MEEQVVESIRKDAECRTRKFRRDVIDSEHGLLKIIGLEAIPFVEGLILSGAGRLTGFPELPLVPIVMDLTVNGQGYYSLRGLWTLTKYAIGASIPYIPEIAQHLSR